MAFGATAEFVTADFGTIAAGVTIIIPPDMLLVADGIVSLRRGASVFIPAEVVAFADRSASLRAGKRVGVPADHLEMDEGRFVFSISAIVRVPPDVSMSWIASMPRISSGTRIAVASDVLTGFNVGATAESPTAADATAASSTAFQLVKLPDQLRLVDLPVRLSSGGSARIPMDHLTMVEPRFEVNARRRKLKINVIAS